MRDLDKVSRYWGEQLERERRHWSSYPTDHSVEILLQLARRSSRILEIGVGTGRMLDIMRNRGVSAKFMGIDLLDSMLSGCTAGTSTCDVSTMGVVGDARALPFSDASFDLVYSLGVVEHFPETARAIEEHARVTRPGGHVLVTTPHLCVFTPLRCAVHALRERGSGTFEEIRGRNIRLTTMTRHFQRAGLRVIDKGVFGVFGNKVLNKHAWVRKTWRYLEKNVLVGAFLYVVALK